MASKTGEGHSNIVDLVKARLGRLLNSLTEEEVNAAFADFKQWEVYCGKLAKWFQGTIVLSLSLSQKYQTY